MEDEGVIGTAEAARKVREGSRGAGKPGCGCRQTKCPPKAQRARKLEGRRCAARVNI